MKQLFFIIIFSFSSILFAQNVPLYVGTYTENNENEGIYTYSFNCKTGELTTKKLAVKTVNPSFLTLSSNKKYVYAVSEMGDSKGALNSFKVKKDNSLMFLNSVNSNGDHPCHVQLNKDNSTVVVSNYTGGNISLYKIENGILHKSFQIADHNITIEKAHAHSAKFYKQNMFAADLGRSFLAHYVLNSDGKYSLKKEILMKDKAGPRHFEISKRGKFIYVINELNSTIGVLKNNNENYSNIQNTSTLNANYKGESFCADIHLSKNEQFLYGSNRGENSIVVFKRNKQTGILTKIQSIDIKGNWPRNFTLSPNGKFLLVANQYSNNICIFTVDKKTGKLSFIKDYKQAAPVCLVF